MQIRINHKLSKKQQLKRDLDLTGGAHAPVSSPQKHWWGMTKPSGWLNIGPVTQTFQQSVEWLLQKSPTRDTLQ